MPAVDEKGAFYHWLAGFVAGEGCFTITHQKPTKYYYPYFRILLRDDDLDILLEIQERLSIGTITYHSAEQRSPSAPAVTWQVVAQSELMVLCGILDDHPIRAKKRVDYGIWREAVMENQKPPEHRDIARLRYLSQKLALVKRYQGNPGELEEPQGCETVQLTLPMSGVSDVTR